MTDSPAKEQRVRERRSVARPGGGARWWELQGSELAKAVEEIAGDLKQHCEGIRSRCEEAVTRYEGLDLSGLDPRSYLDAELTEFKFGLARSIVNTCHAELVGRPKNRPRIITTGAKWETMRKAKRAERVLRGQMSLRQGPRTDVWAVRNLAWRWAEVCGRGHLKVTPGTDRVHVDLVYPWELIVDPVESYGGAPVTYLHVYPADAERLIDLYVDGDDEATDEVKADRHAAIESAVDAWLVTGAEKYGRVMNAREVIELHRVQQGPESPGRIVTVCGGVVMAEREWKRQGSQFVNMFWSPTMVGWNGTGLCDEVAGIDDVLDQSLEMVKDNFLTRDGRRIYVNAASAVDDTELQSNECETIVHYAGDHPPIEQPIPPLDAGELEWLEFLIRKAYEQSGVSQMAATARKSPGVNSGKAMRAEQDIYSKRMSVQGGYLDSADIDLYTAMLYALQDAAEVGDGKVPVRWLGSEGTRDTHWKDCDVSEEIYDVEVQSESATATSVAGRISELEEAVGAGLISTLTFQNAYRMTLDVDSTADVAREQFDYLEDVIDDIMDANPDDPDWAYDPPEGLLPDKAGAIGQVTAAYFRARRAKAPEWNLEQLRIYIQALDNMVAAASAANMAAQKAAAVPGAPQPGQMEGAQLPAPGAMAA